MSSKTLLILMGLAFVFFNSEEIEHYVSEKTEFGAALSPELPPLPSLPTNLLAKSNDLAEAASRNPQRSNLFIGFFYALANCVSENPELISTTSNLQSLIAASSQAIDSESSQYGSFPPEVSQLANDIIAESVGTLDQKELTSEERAGAISGLMACEWAIRQGAIR